ncbi:MAG TPA: polysaccharide biosynthesis tyrosine autokinase [Solirubrobacterales bacterium]
MNRDQASEQTPALSRGLAIARRHWLVILVCLLTVPIIAFCYSKLQTKEYTASASLLFANANLQSQLSGLTPPNSVEPIREMATNLRLAGVDQIADRTAKALPNSGLDSDEVQERVSVAAEGESELIGVSATDPSPRLAARLANEFAEQFIDFSREIESAKVVRAQKLAETRLEGLPPAELESPTGESLERQVRELQALATIQTGRAEMAQLATVPEAPSSPQTKRNVALGVLLGILLAIGVVLLLEQIDRRIRDPKELEAIYGVPLLGMIPESASIARHNGLVHPEADAAAEEAFRMLRANLRYFNSRNETGSLLFTSAAPQDGKTVVSWNVAFAEAAAGQSVLCIEADMRRPSMARELGVQAEVGLGLVLAESLDSRVAIKEISGVDLLPAGPLPPNPGELLGSRQMRELLEWAHARYDRVIIDTPPATLTADALPLVGQVGGVVIVSRIKASTRDSAERLHDQLANLNAPLLGVVINRVARPPRSSYYQAESGAARFEPGNGRPRQSPARVNPNGKSKRARVARSRSDAS